MHTSQITVDALIGCYQLTHGEVEQLHGWVEHFPDLLQGDRAGLLITGPAHVAVRRIREGRWLPNLRPSVAHPLPGIKTRW